MTPAALIATPFRGMSTLCADESRAIRETADPRCVVGRSGEAIARPVPLRRGSRDAVLASAKPAIFAVSAVIKVLVCQGGPPARTIAVEKAPRGRTPHLLEPSRLHPLLTRDLGEARARGTAYGPPRPRGDRPMRPQRLKLTSKVPAVSHERGARERGRAANELLRRLCYFFAFFACRFSFSVF